MHGLCKQAACAWEDVVLKNSLCRNTCIMRLPLPRAQWGERSRWVLTTSQQEALLCSMPPPTSSASNGFPRTAESSAERPGTSLRDSSESPGRILDQAAGKWLGINLPIHGLLHDRIWDEC
ncbi:nuclear transport factor 2 [Platysternon megacephalum]|uniref:Nuclear transport factor 2 n=1 Tax=Platysternon megacephalum TaxID=55544 RepID=A0A4D9E234_9SAUR|nr:nuclear transport factor 2 [Platysternon megacephalum]